MSTSFLFADLSIIVKLKMTVEIRALQEYLYVHLNLCLIFHPKLVWILFDWYLFFLEKLQLTSFPYLHAYLSLNARHTSLITSFLLFGLWLLISVYRYGINDSSEMIEYLCCLPFNVFIRNMLFLKWCSWDLVWLYLIEFWKKNVDLS